MPTVKGKSEVNALFAMLPGQIEKVLTGAARAAAKVVADEAKSRSISTKVAGAIKTKADYEDGKAVAKIQVKGKNAYLAPWLEYGTSPHFISVDDSQRGGMSVNKLNKKLKEADGDASLVINGKFVGKTVLHPGARPHPFLRPALDAKEGEAMAAAQKYIDSKVKGGKR